VESDIWAVGVLCLKMLQGKSPLGWYKKEMNAVREMNWNAKKIIPSQFSDKGFSVDVADFLEKCLQRKHMDRWQAQQLLDHPFIQFAGENEVLWDILEAIKNG
jgi:serine/threonine protein kinase